MAKSTHAKRSSSPFFEKEAERTAKDERAIQRKVDRSDQKKSTEESGGGAMQAGARVYPVPPLPDQHLRKPGFEAELELKPMYDAPHYKGSEKLLDKVALITGGDFWHRPVGRGALRTRGRRHRSRLSRRAQGRRGDQAGRRAGRAPLHSPPRGCRRRRILQGRGREDRG